MVFRKVTRAMKRLPSRITLGLALSISASLVFAGPPETAPGATTSAAHRAFPRQSLHDRVYGEQAVAALGNRLPEVAAWYGMSTADFARMLREDSTAWLDRGGRLFYIEQAPQAAEPFNPTDPLQPALFPLDQTFTLNSRPGSKRVIYLDFDGHQTTGTAWNASYGSLINSPAYTTDTDPAFSTAELQNIQTMWKQVAEDYAPFDVNVTTQDPGPAAITRSGTGDEYYGTRVVITRDNFAACGCGGFAYLTAFNDTDDYYKPAFVFNTSLIGAGEAISHEVGHNLGLNHDGIVGGAAYYEGHGSGATGWAPIMGAGYYQKLVQWSKGEYSGANNTEDDIAKIPSYGATLMVDDHSDTATGATVLDAAANGGTSTLSGRGLIGLRGDIDYFSFVSGAGSYSLAVNLAPYSPDLDIQAKLYNSAGTLIATSNPVDTLPAALSGSLAAGTYFLAIDGVGKGDPLTTGYSDYGSLGRYTVSGTVPGSSTLIAPVAVASAPDYTPGNAPLYVGFDGAGSSDADGAIVAWNWNFGDGSSASGTLVNHTYNAPGNYTAKLTVTDNDGLTASASLAITVLNQAPVAAASADKTSGTAPLVVAFSGSGSSDPDGSITSYGWSFGDGGTATTANPSHTYSTAGNFTATLTVADNKGATDTDTVALTITAPPVLVQRATGEVIGAGTVTGTYFATQAVDGSEESIRERLSGGSKSSRYSYLEHTWLFSVQSGSSVTFNVTGRRTASTDGDTMVLAYSLNGGASYQNLPISLGTLKGSYSAALPAATAGSVRIRVRDSNRAAGSVALDTVYIDEMNITTLN
jgi:PKD repeat protein